MRIITARFASKCGNTGKPIKKGDRCYYDAFQKKVFTIESVDAATTTEQRETESIRGYIDAQEEAMFERY